MGAQIQNRLSGSMTMLMILAAAAVCLMTKNLAHLQLCTLGPKLLFLRVSICSATFISHHGCHLSHNIWAHPCLSELARQMHSCAKMHKLKAGVQAQPAI